MERFVGWLSKHRWVNIAVICTYFPLVVLPHKMFGTFLNTKVFVGITRAQYNLYVLIAASVLLLIYAWYFHIAGRDKHYRGALWAYMIYNIALAVIIINILFVINIEIVHFPQYALMAVLLFPLLSNYQATLIWTTLAGALDEAYQYFVLAPDDTFYYDFNDVVTNLVGASFGLLIIWAAGIRGNRPFRSHSKFILMATFTLIVLLVILYRTKVLSIYPSKDHQYQLLRKDISGFWYAPNKRVTYHVMKPMEGMVATLLLMLSKWKLGSFPEDHRS